MCQLAGSILTVTFHNLHQPVGKCDGAFKDLILLTLQVSSLLGLCGRMNAALLRGPLHESAACVKSKQLVRTT